MDEQLTFDASEQELNSCPDQLERKAFNILLPTLDDIFQELNADRDFLIFAEIQDCSSVYLLSNANLVFRIRIRKKKSYVSIPEEYASLLPNGLETSRTKNDAGMLRVHIQAPDGILLCKDAIRESLRHEILTVHTFDCCGRYEECSDAMHCIHPDPKAAVGCSYKRNLAEGRVFYGKNRNI